MSCEGCKWWDSFSWVCCNADSEHCADFTNEGCKWYEKPANGVDEELNETICRHLGNKIPDREEEDI